MTSFDLESEFSANRLRLNDRSDALNAYDVALPPLDVSAPEHDAPLLEVTDAPVLDEEEGDRCSICLNDFRDRAVLPACSHEFCFECISIWTEQSRRCPLCTGFIGEHIVHRIRGPRDFQRYFLPPLRTSPPTASRPLQPLPSIYSDYRSRPQRSHHARARVERDWGRRDREREELDELERAVEKRRWVYTHRLFAKHVASNTFTRYRPFPTPAQFAASDDLQKRATAWLRREFRVFPTLEIEWLTTFVVSLMRALDIRSEGAVKLLSEFLDMDDPTGERANAAQFAHELYSYMRSPYRDLFVYDSVVQYDAPIDVPPPHVSAVGPSHWRPPPRQSTSRSRSRSRSRHRSPYSPASRQYERDRKYAGGHPHRPRTPAEEDEDDPDHSPRDWAMSHSPSSRRHSRSPELVSQKQHHGNQRTSNRDRRRHPLSSDDERYGVRPYPSSSHRHHSLDHGDHHFSQDRKGKGKARIHNPEPNHGQHRRSPDRSQSHSPLSEERHALLSHGRIETAAPLPQQSLEQDRNVPPPIPSSFEAAVPTSKAISKPPLELRIRGAARVLRGTSLKSSIAAHLGAPTVVNSTRRTLEDRLVNPPTLTGATNSSLLTPSVAHDTRGLVALRPSPPAVAAEPAPQTSTEISRPTSATFTPVEGVVLGERAGREVGALRDALLARLEGERRLASGPTVPVLEDRKGKGKAHEHEDTAGEEAEQRLRAQAHVRMRLSRAKRDPLDGRPGEGRAETIKDDVGGRAEKKARGAPDGEDSGQHRGRAGDLDSLERQAKLRAQLARRRM